MSLQSLLRCLCLLAALLPIATPRASADAAQALFARGNEALARGDAAAAVRLYRELTETGSLDPDLEYNLSLAHARLGQLGHALWHLERAHDLRPGDSEVLDAIREVQDALGKRQAAKEGEATVQTRPPLHEALTGWLSPNALAGTLWVAVALASLAWLVLQRDRREGRRLTAGVVLVVASLLACLAGAALAVRGGAFRDGPRAIVLEDDVAMRSAPDDHAPRVRSLAEGTRATLLEELGGHARIQVGDQTGWLPRQALGRY